MYLFQIFAACCWSNTTLSVKCITLDRNGDTFTLLIQDAKGRVIIHSNGLTFYDAVRTMDETMEKEKDNGNG